jgi:hypothetical protein
MAARLRSLVGLALIPFVGCSGADAGVTASSWPEADALFTSDPRFTDPSGAIGVATQDQKDGRFRPGPTALWTPDRPPYGTVAVAVATDVDVVGCRNARFLDSDCFMARVPAASLDDESAYAYYVGGGRYSTRIDEAWPMTTGPSSLDVVPWGDRWLMAYVSPLGSTITVRSGLSRRSGCRGCRELRHRRRLHDAPTSSTIER